MPASRDDAPADIESMRLLRERVETLEAVLAERTAELHELRSRPTNNGAARAPSEAACLESEARLLSNRLLTIIDCTPDLVGIADAAGRLVYLNRAGRTMLGVTSDGDLTQHQYWHYCTSESREALMLYAIPAALRDGAWLGETVTRRIDGSEFPTSTVVVTHPAQDGSVEFFSLVVRDMSSEKQLAERLRQSQKMEAVGRLAGGVAHDFNNILTAIIGTTELLLSDIPADDPTRDDVNDIRLAADRAATLTRQLLAYSRRQMLQPRVLALNAVVGNMETMLRRLVGEHIALSIDLGSDECEVKADLSQLEQVITNLVVNVRDAMPDGGRLSITTSKAQRVEAASIDHGLMLPGRYGCLEVRDTGFGMDPHTLAHCFEPFFTTKPQSTGTGLGLATVYGIVKQSGGYVWCDSTGGAGATFTVFLPLHDGDPAVDAESNISPAARKAVTLLLVEDEEHVRRVAARTLRRRGYEVLEAAHGPDALAIARAHSGTIDLLLTDMVMPQMSGSDLACQLLELRPDLRVLYASGYITDNVPGAGGRIARRSAFIQKPFTAQLLEEKIRELLNGD